MTIESRGKDATGFAWQEKNDDENTWYSKRKGKASNIASTLALPYNGITNLAAHTRYLTLGTADDNDNNHPVTCDGVTAVHNGRIENHEELIALSGVERVGMVDSFAIPALLSAQYTLGANHPTELLELIEGVASMAWFDADTPGVMHLARCSTRPLTVGWTKRGDLVYSSTRRTLEAGMKRAGIGIYDVIDIPEGVYLRVANGAFEEWQTFKVRHPKMTLDLDQPGKGGRANKVTRKATKVVPEVVSYDRTYVPDTYLDIDGNRQPWPMWDDDDQDCDTYLDNLADFDSWESQVDARIDGINWDGLVPRRPYNRYGS